MLPKPKTNEPQLEPVLHEVSPEALGGFLRRRWVRGLLSMLALALLIAGVVMFALWRAENATSASGRPGAAGTRPLPVIASAARTGDIDVSLDGLGTVTPLNMVTVKTRVDGQLMKLLFREGQLVKAGDVLAEIDPRPFEVQLTQAQGQMARDESLLRNAQLDLERYRTLFAQDSIARQQLDTQQALVHQYEGTVKADQGSVDSARLQLTYARVTAPISGRVGLRQVDPGNIVHAADANGLVVITQVQPVTVVFTLPEDSIPSVLKRQRAGGALAVDAYDRDQKVKLASGKLVAIDNQIDTTTGTVKLKAQFPNADGALFPNQFVNVRMQVDTLHDAVVAPSAAIQRGSPGTFVYVVKDDNSVTVRPVKLGTTQAGSVSIASGLSAGELVVVDGADKLREGAKVETVTKESQLPPPAQPRRRDATSPNASPPRGERPRRADGQRRSDGSSGP